MKDVFISKDGMPYLRMGTGEPLVLIHGLGGIKENWTKQYELTDQYELIIPDLRGHGDNPEIQGISIKNFAKDVLSLLDELNIKCAHICGLSMGGTVAQEIYQQAPEKCHSLLLVSTFHYAPKQLGRILFPLRNARSLLLTKEQQRMMTARTCLYSWEKNNIEEFIKNYKPRKIGYNRAAKACLEVDYRSLLPNIKVPTLVIGGQYDSILPVWIQLHMHKHIPNSEFVIFRKCGHIAKVEAAEHFNLTLRRFLNKHRMVNKAC